MSILHTVTRQYRDQSSSFIQLVEQISGNYEANLDVAAVPIAANTHYVWAVTRANLLALCLYAADTITIYTNNPSGSSPQDTIVFAAGQTLIWSLATDLIARCPFSGNVTSLYVTNGTAAVVAMKIRAVLNQ